MIILALTVGVLYINSIGLPGFIKKPLLEKLHARGLDLQFTRLRWRPIQGIVAENVFFGRTNDVSSPQLTLKEVQVRLDYPAFLKRQFQVKSLALHQGNLMWPVTSSNGLPRELSIKNIQTDLQLLTNDVWELDDLQAQFAGVKIQLTGAVTNASVVRDWKVFHGAQPAPPGTLENRLRRLADTLEQVHFPDAAPELKLDMRGDARDVENMAVHLSLAAPNARIRPGEWPKISKCIVQLSPSKSNQLSRAEIKMRAASAVTPWDITTNLVLTLHLASLRDTNLIRGDLDLTADSTRHKTNCAEKVHLTAQWVHSFTNAVPLSGHASNT